MLTRSLIAGLALSSLIACGEGTTPAPVGSGAVALATTEYEAAGILAVANSLSQTELDEDVGLDARAAANIVAGRPFADLAALDAVPYVGDTALGLLLDWAQAHGQVGACGDGVVQPFEACDGSEGCPATCQAPEVAPATVHGVTEGTYAALAILALVNSADQATLDIDVALDARAASGIVGARPIYALTALDAVPYVGADAFANLLAYVTAQGLPGCGDGTLQIGLEACDDGNQVAGDGCSAACTVEDAGGTPIEPGAVLVHGFAEATYPALGILAVANGADLAVLDDGVGLDTRAAQGIVAARAQGPLPSLTALDAVPYVGAQAFERLYAYAVEFGFVPACGDGIVQAIEVCDGQVGCSETCEINAVCGNGIWEFTETCDDGNVGSGDGCSRTCAAERLTRLSGSTFQAPHVMQGHTRLYGRLGYRSIQHWRFTTDVATRLSAEIWSGTGDAWVTIFFRSPLGTPTSKYFDARVTLRDAQNREVARVPVRGGQRGERLQLDLPPGTWYLRVEDPGTGMGYSSEYQYDYQMEILRTP